MALCWSKLMAGCWSIMMAAAGPGQTACTGNSAVQWQQLLKRRTQAAAAAGCSGKRGRRRCTTLHAA